MTDNTLQQRIDELEATIATQQAHIEEIETNTESLESQVEELEAENETLKEQLTDRAAKTDQLRERITQLEAQPSVTIADESDPIGSLQIAGAPVGRAISSKPGETELYQELDALRKELDTDPDDPSGTQSEPTIETETPLEEIVALPQRVVDDQLTANQRRARFVATDLTEYATKTPAGWVLTPKDLRTVLNAAFDTSHSQTCSRVRTILADLGDSEVSIKESRGEKKLVCAESIVRRLQRFDDDGGHSVVSPMEG
jgi:regulator of replication initiation timing